MRVQAAIRTVLTLAVLLKGMSAAAQSAADWEAYGQLNFGAMSVDNGGMREDYFAENPSVPSRAGFFLTLPTDGQGRLRFNFETGFGLTNLGSVSPDNDDLEVNLDRTVIRKFELIYDSPTFGTVSLGQGSMASDGASGSDLSGTGLAIGPAIGDLGGGTEFLLLNDAGSGVFVSDAFDDLDGPRRFRIRYDTPQWNGLSLAAAYGQEVLRSGDSLDYRDLRLHYARDSETFTIEAATSYEWLGNAEERFLASASLRHKPTGLNASLATGHNQIGSGDYVYAKLGATRDWVRLGSTSIAVEYYDGSDFSSQNATSRAIGIGAVQQIDALKLDLVFAHRQYSLTDASAKYQDVTVTMLGARWRF